MLNKKKVVLIGASYRGMHGFLKNIKERHEDHEIVAICDMTMEKIQDLNDYFGSSFKGYTDCDEMLKSESPDVAIIANIDRVHVDYLEKTLAEGVRTVVEKPLCVDAEQCRRVRGAIAEYPNADAVTAHNLRYLPASLKIKEILDLGSIGEIISINFTEMMDVDHGASYFHRWNRTMRNSGGLLVHKASHHFDLMNWFVGAYAKEVSAHGALLAYGAENRPFPEKEIAPNCRECAKTADECKYRSCLGSGVRYQMHKSNINIGGYTPDLCVFSPEIDIYDHVGVGISFQNRVHACYTLCAHSAVELMRIEIEGSKARLEYEIIYTTAPNDSKSEGDACEPCEKLEVVGFGKSPEIIEIPVVDGGHGGADVLMCRDLFGQGESDAKATLEDGIQAVLVGAAANESIKSGRSVDVQNLLSTFEL